MSTRGFTLFELLVVLVVVGILATVALPAYRRHVLRVNRSEAMTLLLDLQGAEERHYLVHDRYTNSIEAAPPAGLGLPVSGTSNKYTLSVSLASDGQTYIATASPVGAQAADLECLSFSVDARGRRAVSGAGGIRRCWR
jgi:type IV pilus assembly protein PilE